MTNYGSKIAELRKQKNLTQAELGAELNISAQAVSKWENGLSEPDIDSLKKLATIFGVSIDELLSPPIEKEQPTENSYDNLRGGHLPDYLKSSEPEEAPTSEPVITTSPVVEQKIINGYCEKCKKPVGPSEYDIRHETFSGSKIEKSSMQHIYCKDCSEKLSNLISEEKKRAQAREKAKKEAAQRQQIIENQKFFWKGIICGIITFVVGLIVAISSGASADGFFVTFSSVLGGSVLIALLVCQLVWGGWLADFVAAAKDWSWRAPGLIFTWDLDGFMWLIGMKILFAFLGIIFSAIVFLAGFFIACLIAPFAFPFAFIKALKGEGLED